MTDSPASAQDRIRIVRGEMQPWTDFDGAQRPAGGPVVRAFLADVLPQTPGRTLIAGPHGYDVIEAVAARGGEVSVLLRSVSDATTLREALPADNITVITGALDGMDSGDQYDVIIAADGLDRLLSSDSPALNWVERATLLSRLAAPGALTVVALENEFALTGLLDSRPLDQRHGDDEWWPLHDDPARPVSAAQTEDVLRELGIAVRRTYALFDDAGHAHTLLDITAAARTRPGRLGAQLAVAGLETAAASKPLLAPVGDSADAAARAGQLGAVASGWLVVSGPAATTKTAYTEAFSADLTGDVWQITSDSALIPARVPDTETLEAVLFRLAAAEDVPGFRAVAAQFGQWADGLVLLDDVHTDGDDLARGVRGLPVPEGAGPPELLAAAWHRFRDRLLHGHRRHPWPPWMADSDDLVKTWLGMSGVEAGDDVVKRGRQIADALAGPVPAEIDVRTRLADAAEAKLKAKELAGQIFGLERTMRFRDQSLKTREKQLRDMRAELRLLRGARSTKVGVLVQKAGLLREPRKFARGVKRRLRRLRGR